MKWSVGTVALLALALASPADAQEVIEVQRKLKVGTKIVRPFAYKDEQNQWTGISIDLWDRIAGKLGLRFEWVEAPNTNTLIEKVASGEYDVGIAAITMKPSRATIVDFSNSMFKSGLGIATRAKAPGALAMLAQIFSGGFLKMAGLLVGLLLSVGTIIWLFERKRNSEHFPKNPASGIFTGFWWSAVTMTAVGYGDAFPKSVPGRLFALVWMFIGVFTVSSFTAVIASSLTTQQLQSAIRGPQDLPYVSVGAKKNESPISILKKRGIRARAFDSISEGLQAVDSGEIDAFVHDTPVIQAELFSEPSLAESVITLPRPIRVEEYGIAVKRPEDRKARNELREGINTALLELKISGEYDLLVKKYLGTTE